MEEFALIDMNGRVYDPMLGRFFSPDPYVQLPGYAGSYNRYSYCLNNPLVYTDPSGNSFNFWKALFFAPFGLAGISPGMNWASGESTFGQAMGEYAINATAFIAGAGVGGLDIPFSNTLGILAGSHVNSVGMGILSGGQTDYTLSFGAASISMGSQGIEFGYLGKPNNSKMQNIGYGFGAMANLQDAFAAFNKPIIDENGNKIRPDSKIYVKSRKEIAGHSWIEGKDINISVGPAVNNKPHLDGVKWELQYIKTVKGRNFITSYDPKDTFTTTLNNVNTTKLQRMTNFLNDGLSLSGKHSLRYGVWNGCVNQTSRALFRAGVFNFNTFLPITFPVLLNAELALRNYGMMFSYYMITYE